MQRRKFIELLVGMAATWPLAVRSQQRLPTIGFLGSASPEVARRWVAAFVSRLRELGWIEGRTVAIEYRWADAHPERYAEIATEFVILKGERPADLPVVQASRFELLLNIAAGKAIGLSIPASLLLSADEVIE